MRARNRSRASAAAGTTSDSRNSRTLARSSLRSGRSCMPCPPRQVVHAIEHLELHLRRPAPEAGQLHAALLAAQVAVGLSEAAQRPAEVARGLPERKPVLVD